VQHACGFVALQTSGSALQHAPLLHTAADWHATGTQVPATLQWLSNVHAWPTAPESQVFANVHTPPAGQVPPFAKHGVSLVQVMWLQV